MRTKVKDLPYVRADVKALETAIAEFAQAEKNAKTVEDVRRFYESKVPMNRGCLPIDVARAVMYCVEQKYETGQAIPVTGGQVMLN